MGFSGNKGMETNKNQKGPMDQRSGSESISHGNRHGHAADNSGKENAEIRVTQLLGGQWNKRMTDSGTTF